jgi:hypothetical protein
MAMIVNPFAERFADDLRPLFKARAMLGERPMQELVKLLDEQAVSYGKGAVGVDGEMEHGGACVGPMLGGPMRAVIGGGKAMISSKVKPARASVWRSTIRTIPGRSLISTRSLCQWPTHPALVVIVIVYGGRQQSAAGMRTEPPVSVPIATMAASSATETAAPDKDPPGTQRRSAGLPGVP